jgi:hypothetical protein
VLDLAPTRSVTPDEPYPKQSSFNEPLPLYLKIISRSQMPETQGQLEQKTKVTTNRTDNNQPRCFLIKELRRYDRKETFSSLVLHEIAKGLIIEA